MPFWMKRQLHPRKADTVIWDGQRAHVIEVGNQLWVVLLSVVKLKVDKPDWNKNFRYDFQQSAWLHDEGLVKASVRKHKHLTK